MRKTSDIAKGTEAGSEARTSARAASSTFEGVLFVPVDIEDNL